MVSHYHCPFIKRGAVACTNLPEIFNLLKVLDIPWNEQGIQPLGQRPRPNYSLNIAIVAGSEVGVGVEKVGWLVDGGM